MIEKIKKLFGIEKDEVKEEGKNQQSDKYKKLNNYIKKEKVLYNSEYDPNKKNIIIMDDKKDIIDGLIDDLFILDEKGIINIDDYNIFMFYGKMAGFNVIDFIKEFNDIVKIDYALLDIIVGGKRYDNGKKIIVDGIDVAYELKKVYNDVYIVFYTGCMIENEEDMFMNISYVNKFKKYFDDNLYNYLISKSENIDTELVYIQKFLNGEYGF